MNFLIEILQWIFQAMNSPVADGVSFANPAWIIPLAAGAVAGGIRHFATAPGRRRARRETSRLGEQRDELLDEFISGISEREERGEDIQTDASVEELYGTQIQQITDRVAADVGGARSGIFRAMAVGGGDVTGAGSEMIRGLGEQGQRTIADVIAQYTQRTDQRNVQQKIRQDRIFSETLGAKEGAFRDVASLHSESRGRLDRMKQANAQFFLDALGLGAATGGQIAQNKLLKQGLAGG